MKYYSKVEIENAIRNNEPIIINDEIVDRMRTGELDPYILREGLCGRDVRSFDFSNLSDNYLAYLSFDTETKFPEYLQGKAMNLLENAKNIMQEITILHSKGIDGTGKKITIIDTPFQTTKEDDDIDYYSMDGVETENHGITVLSIIRSIVPNAQVVFIGDNKRAGKNRNDLLNSFIRKNVGSTTIADSDIVSISSPISIDSKLINDQCEILNSPRFYSSSQDNLGFRYGFVRRNSDNEKIEPADCISEGKDRREIEKFCLQELEKLGLSYSNISQNNIYEIVRKLKEAGILENDPKVAFIKQVATSDEEYRISSINEDKLVTPGIASSKDLVCIPSAGITVRQNGGKFKYMATNSNSFSIPVVSALFIMARQINPTISLEDFSKICRETSVEKDGIKTISPIRTMEAIEERQKSCTLQEIGQGTIHDFEHNTGDAIKSFEEFEHEIAIHTQANEGQIRGEN